ncbi:dUTP diphosphatase [Pseudoloma neurophilia]|uniref:Deoxyuridine 5'-triphosphate nucleotidohydrolase n=1 Tax=Pseudoloma neurophilia TaxID=146866 RepID=A0A0R0M100_9MICR|nr:dUTP diphosphatase [Pseudoloma neurophilia]
MSDQSELRVNLHTENPELMTPKRQTEGAAGYDIYSPISVEIPANSTVKIELGFSLEMPLNMVVKTYMRSGLAFKNSLCLTGNTFFFNNQNLYLEIENLSTETFFVEKNLRIAQLVFHERF